MSTTHATSAKGKHRRILWICLVFVLLACVGVWLWQQQASAGAFAEIAVDGVCVARLSLTQDITYTVPNIEGVNIVTIEDGWVYMQTADCPDKICIQQGKMHRQGECIVCLPHKVVVTVVGDTQDGIDAIV